MTTLRDCEWSDEYPRVVAAFGPTMRLIVDRHGFGWTLQRRRAKAGRWFQIAAVLRFRRNLAQLVLSSTDSRHVAKYGITLATIEDALSALPESFTDGPTYAQLVINTPAPRRTDAAIYKTEGDRRFAWEMRGREGDDAD